MKATIRTQGRQFIVSEGDTLTVNQFVSKSEGNKNVPLPEGSFVTISEVLSVGEGAEMKVGTPLIEGASVEAQVTEVYKADKVIAFKWKHNGQGDRKRKGHRQRVCTIKIVSIKA